MSAIGKDSTKNYGGIRQMWYAIEADVRELLELKILELSNAKNVAIDQELFDDNFSQLEFMPRTANHDWKDRLSDQGPVYDHEIEAVFHKDRQDIRDEIDHVGFRKLVIIWQDMNRVWKLAWGWEQSEAFGTGKEPKDTNQYVMNWRAVLTYQPLIVTFIVE